MGPSDLLKPVIERHFSGTIHFGRVTVKPGKPTTFASIPILGGKSRERKPVLRCLETRHLRWSPFISSSCLLFES